MTLTTHAIVGAAAASLVPAHPYLGFAAGFVSHLVIDMLPHWDEGPHMLRSIRKNHADRLRNDMVVSGRDFVADVLYLAGESLIGLALAVAVVCGWFGLPFPPVFIGACAGLLPDFLHFVYFKTRLPEMEWFERFHNWLQDEHDEKRYLFVEVALVAACLASVYFLMA